MTSQLPLTAQLRAAQRRVDRTDKARAKAIAARDAIIRAIYNSGLSKYEIARMVGKSAPTITKALERTEPKTEGTSE